MNILTWGLKAIEIKRLDLCWGVTAVLRLDVALLREGRKGLFLTSLDFKLWMGEYGFVFVSFWFTCSLVWSSVGTEMLANMTPAGVSGRGNLGV